MDTYQAVCLGFLVGFVVATIISLVARRENLSDLEVYREHFGEVHDLAGMDIKAPRIDLRTDPRTEAWGWVEPTDAPKKRVDLPPLPDFLK